MDRVVTHRQFPAPRAALVLGAGCAPVLVAAAAQAADEPQSNAASAISGWDRLGTVLVERSVLVGSALRDFPDHVARMLDRLGDGAGFAGLLGTLALIVLLFAGAFALERLASRRLRRVSRALLQLGTGSLGQKLSTLAIAAVLAALELLLFVIIAAVGLKILFAAGSAARELAAAVGFTILATRAAAILIRLALNPANVENRMLPVADADARRLVIWCVAAAAIASAAYFGSGFLALSGFPMPIVNAWFLLFGLAVTAIVLLLLWRYGRVAWPVAAAGERAAQAQPVRAYFAANAHRLIAAVIVASWLLWAANLLLNRREEAWAVLLSASIIVLFPAIDRCYRTVTGWAVARKSAGDAPSAPATWPLGPRMLLLIIRIVLIAATAMLALDAWGVPTIEAMATSAGQKVTHALVTLAVAIPLAMLAWHGSKTLLERKLGGPARGDDTPGTRASTLLPILRFFLLVLLFAIVGLMVLASMGVEIGPLLAGAGVVGLAVGFGAQTLVRDVISGFFFLLDDAFRIGEYIDAGKAKGTVEKISIRSLQLRHHRGALHTVPYGQIQLVSNYNRDWVIEKLEFGLLYGTDPEKVRKLVKKIGQELMDDPELAPEILEPLKSQGVQRFADSGIVFRAKFKCRPNKQFAVRKEAYRRIQETFAANGVEFAYPTVTISGSDDRDEADRAAAQAVALKPLQPAPA